MWRKWKIDYEYGVADLYVKDGAPLQPAEHGDTHEIASTFYDLAYQCFGIRKSIGRTEFFGPNEVDDSEVEAITIRDDSIMSYMLNTPHEKSTEVPEEANYVLAHSGGDVIIWSNFETKIKSEWDD